MYSGYYCKKCKMIPIIKTNIINNEKMNFLIKCECNFQSLTIEQMNKNYYVKNIALKNIINKKIIENTQNGNENESTLFPNLDEFLKKLRNNIKLLPIIKNKFINFINSKLKEAENLFEKAKKIYEIFEKTFLIFINSYEKLKINYSSIKNIEINIYDKMEIIEEKIFGDLLDKSNFDIHNIKNYIYETLPIKPFEEHLELISTLGTDCYMSHILKLSNQYILAKIFQSLGIFSVKDLKFILEISTPDIIGYDINKEKNIICLYPHSIKILPEFSNDKIQYFINQHINQTFTSK